MSISQEIANQVFALPANERFELAHRLLDTIDDSAVAQFDDQFVAELRRRREEMMRGEQVVPDWRGKLAEITGSLSK
jgi:putative addiction module component (TIGR02574 family)